MPIQEISLHAPSNLELRKEFNMETWCITEMYFQEIKKIDFGKIRKVNVHLLDSEETPNTELHGRFLDLYQEFDFKSYFSKPSLLKKKQLLNALHFSILNYANLKGLKTLSLLDAYNRCIEKKLKHEWYLKNRYFRSPDKRFYIRLMCEWELDSFLLTAIFFDHKKNELRRNPVVKTEPHKGDFIYGVDCKWKENNLYVQSQNGELWVLVPEE